VSLREVEAAAVYHSGEADDSLVLRSPSAIFGWSAKFSGGSARFSFIGRRFARADERFDESDERSRRAGCDALTLPMRGSRGEIDPPVG